MKMGLPKCSNCGSTNLQPITWTMKQCWSCGYIIDLLEEGFSQLQGWLAFLIGGGIIILLGVLGGV